LTSSLLPLSLDLMPRQGFGRLLPQFRVTVNSRCGRACFFCRPSGEAVATVAGAELAVDDLVAVGAAVRAAGITGIKLTGGDPALYEPLEFAVSQLRRLGFDEIEVISRHPRIGRRAGALARAGVTLFNMSVDTLDPVLHKEITGVDDHGEVLAALAACVATGVPVKVNAVVMAGINDGELARLADYCAQVGVRTLKLLDVIKDLDAGAESFARRLAITRQMDIVDLYKPLELTTAAFRARAVSVATRTQGGLGHPMTVLTMASGFEVVVKDSDAGAWYGSVCSGCPFFPCHDALMALRLTADLRLQFCLLREDITVPVDALVRAHDSGALERVVADAVAMYSTATFQHHPEKQSVGEVMQL
jgi:GTP 3',8-cyclase